MATGRALLALAADEMPVAEDLPGLRRSMRVVLMHHLGGRGLKSWEMLEDLARAGRFTSGLGTRDSGLGTAGPGPGTGDRGLGTA
ncbi:hypothetical protein XTPLMG728_2217 [Xanthomonas translucens pv. poae]|nr:hypothetical protein XTPLMG728_2217 [Xanthomonas translucens pv. poae]